MPRLTINDHYVTVGDDFLNLPQDQQNATVDEIAKHLPKRGVIDKLTGETGPRYQTFPERLARGVVESFGAGAEVTKKTMTGQYGPTGEGVIEDPQVYQAATLGVTGAPGAEAASAVAGAARSAASRAAQPSKEAIKASSQAAYKAVEDARLIASEGSLNELVSATRAGLDQRLITEQTAQRTYRALEQLQKSGGDIGQIMGVRQRLGEIKPSAGTDFEAAQHVKDAIDHYIETLPPGEIVQGDPKFTQTMLEHARASWRSYAQLDQVESALEMGRHQAAVAGTGANTINTMRQRLRQVLDSDQSRGMSPEAKSQLEDIVMGTWATNWSRWASKFAPSGPVSALTTTTGALVGALSGGGEMAAAVAAGIAIPAVIAKYLGTFLTKRQIAELENIIKSESPLGRAATKGAQRAGQEDAEALLGATPALVPGAASGLAPRPTITVPRRADDLHT